MCAPPSPQRTRAEDWRTTLRARVVTWLACAAGVLALAACGSTIAGSGTAAIVASSRTGQALAFSQCMRSHGLPNFPDPSNGAILLGPSAHINPQSPSFQSAQHACQKLIPGFKGGGPIPAAVRERLLAMARCMRSHGVPNFPDPTFSGGGVAVGAKNLGIDPRSPAFQQAARACGGPVLGHVGNSAGAQTDG